jgi:hypothetical protein
MPNSSQPISVLLVVDTDSIQAQCANPSQDAGNPTAIDHQGHYLICNRPRGRVGGQATADLNFKAQVGDQVSFFATSVYNNSDSAVILYAIQHRSDSEIFHPFSPELAVRKAAVKPDPDSQYGIPPVRQRVSFTTFSSQIKRYGIQRFHLCLAVYVLGEDGQTQNLYGYFLWDPTIMVSRDLG